MNELAPVRASAPSRLESAWTARMVRPTADAGVGHPASFLRKEFDLDVPLSASATLRITALGLYRAFINGRRVGNDLLTPGWTTYDRRLAYQTYDVLARPVRAYGYAYPFIELGLGIAYLARLVPVVTSVVTLVVMLVSVVGVTQALLQRRRIQCACLGTVFNLPMTKVTFVEDALMAGMALAMLVGLWA